MTGPGVSLEYEVTALRYGTRTARRSEVFLHFELDREPDRELAFWTSPLSRKPLFMTATEEADLDALRQLSEAGRVDFISGRASVAPGIEAVEIGGHTPGQLAVIVGTARGETVFASDALHYYEEMTQDRPFAHVTDVPAMYAGFAWLREQQTAGRDIVAGHDPQVMQRYPAVAGAARLAVRVG